MADEMRAMLDQLMGADRCGMIFKAPWKRSSVTAHNNLRELV